MAFTIIDDAYVPEEKVFDLLGCMCFEGVGGPVDRTLGEKALRRAINSDDNSISLEAMSDLGMYLYAMENRLREAIQLLQNAADRGNSNAQVNLGKAYYEGKGVPQNEETAAYYFGLAAKQGNQTAIDNLTVMETRRSSFANNELTGKERKEDSPFDPATCRKRLQTILDHVGCKRVRFHDLRHLFVTTALESGMDVKTLSAIISHVSAKTTLNTYTHITNAMRQTAAAKIDRGIGKCEPQDKPGSDSKGLPVQTAETRRKAVFEPYKGKNRKRGTGCMTQINDHLWEGRYSPKWPDGKIHSRNVYADNVEECETKLAELIRQMRAEIVEAKELTAQGKLDEAMALANGKKPRGVRKAEFRL